MNQEARLAFKAESGEIVVNEKAPEEAGMNGSGLEARSLKLKGISEPVRVSIMRLRQHRRFAFDAL